jgi:hypothetical protein
MELSDYITARPVLATARPSRLEEPPEDEEPERYPAPDEPCARGARLPAPAPPRPRRFRRHGQVT